MTNGIIANIIIPINPIILSLIGFIMNTSLLKKGDKEWLTTTQTQVNTTTSLCQAHCTAKGMVCSWGRYSNQKETRMRETVPFSYSYFLKLITMMFTLIFTKENNCGNLTIVCFDLVKILLSAFMLSLLSL